MPKGNKLYTKLLYYLQRKIKKISIVLLDTDEIRRQMYVRIKCNAVELYFIMKCNKICSVKMVRNNIIRAMCMKSSRSMFVRAAGLNYFPRGYNWRHLPAFARYT